MATAHTAKQEAFIQTNAGELREKIAIGLDQIRRDEVVDGKTAIQTLREKLHQREHPSRPI